MKIIGTLVKDNYRKLLNECSFVEMWFINLEQLSFSHFNNFSLNEFENIIKEYPNNKYIINLEKLYSEDELTKIEKIINKFVDNEKVYFSYSDLGVYQLLIERKSFRKIYHSSTMVTNLNDIEIVLKENEKFIMGKEISFEELVEIDGKLSKKIDIDAFGKFPIFYSKRKLLSTYFKYRKYDYNSNDLDYTLVEEFRDDEYPITEKNETIVYEPFFYVLGNELQYFKNIENIVIYPQFLTTDEYINILNLYHSFIKNDFNILNDKTFEESLNVACYKGKLSEKTILKKGDK